MPSRRSSRARRPIPSSGRFSNFTAAARVDKFKIFSWNARALLHNKIKKQRQAKLKLLRSFTEQADVILIQESHGIQGEAERQLLLEQRKFVVLHDPGEPADAGGIITLINKNMVTEGPPVVTPLEKGRIHAVTIHRNGNSIHYINVHNFNISDEGMRKTHKFLQDHSSGTSPSGGAQTIWIGGDFNFLCGDESPKRIDG